MVDTGLIDYWSKEAMHKSLLKNSPVEVDLSVSSPSTPSKELSLNNLQGAFVVLGLGIAAASLAFILEKCCHYKKI